VSMDLPIPMSLQARVGLGGLQASRDEGCDRGPLDERFGPRDHKSALLPEQSGPWIDVLGTLRVSDAAVAEGATRGEEGRVRRQSPR